MDGFTPLGATLGGVMIGASASLLLVLNGRIAGISGILGGLMAAPSRDTGWRAGFLAVSSWHRSPTASSRACPR